ncbi:MAG: amino acid transporter [Acidobacteria bacterium]|nr:MAG: amino acid transporter [Acidobacteriota bacterium]
MTNQKGDQGVKLVRGLSLLDATMIVIGSMIGSGIFLTSAESAKTIGSPGWLLAAWALAGLLTITGALCCAELAAMMPRAGGQYVFLREAYGSATGFLFGWSLLFVIQTGTIAAVAVAFARFLGVLAPETISESIYIIAPTHLFGSYAISLSTAQLVAIILILLLTFTNTRGLKTGKLIQNTFTFTKTAALVGLILVGLLLGWNSGSAAHTASWWNPSANGWNPQTVANDFGPTCTTALVMLLGLAMVGPLFAQSAWNNVTFTGSEVREPGRNLPRALLIGCLAVVGLYLLANLAYVGTLPLGIIQKPQTSVATATMQAVMGRPGTILMAVAIMVSTFGCNNGLILAGARVYYAMARDRLFFSKLGTLNRKHVPAIALITQGIWASFLTLPRTETIDAATGQTVYGNVYTQLLEYIVSADLVFYALMVGAVIVMRRKAPKIDRPYRTFGYPFVPLLYILIAALLVLDLALLKRQTSGIGYLLVLTGLPIYLIWRRSAAPRSAFATETADVNEGMRAEG